MVEYGNGIGQGPAGQVGGGGGGGGGGGDLGIEFMRAASGAIDTVARLPTEQLVVLIIAVALICLFVLRRAF